MGTSLFLYKRNWARRLGYHTDSGEKNKDGSAKRIKMRLPATGSANKFQKPRHGFIKAIWLPERSRAFKVAFRYHFSLSKSFGATCNTSSMQKKMAIRMIKSEECWLVTVQRASGTYTLVNAWPVVEILAGAVLLPTSVALDSLDAFLCTAHKLNKERCFARWTPRLGLSMLVVV